MDRAYQPVSPVNPTGPIPITATSSPNWISTCWISQSARTPLKAPPAGVAPMRLPIATSPPFNANGAALANDPVTAMTAVKADSYTASFPSLPSPLSSSTARRSPRPNTTSGNRPGTMVKMPSKCWNKPGGWMSRGSASKQSNQPSEFAEIACPIGSEAA